MNLLRNVSLAALAGVALYAASSAGASAAIVCSGDDCWHARSAYDYPASANIVVHDDGWRWADHEKYRWREHEGRGFWRGERWEEF